MRTPLPLLAKEMMEQAARRRTYLVRVGYALFFFAAFCVLSYGTLRRSGFSVAQLGVGRGMFKTLVVLQFYGIVLLLPAMMAGTVAGEKQTGGLGLLLITDLRPTEVLLQKYVSRLIPMATFLLLALPLLAISYALGGISREYLVAGVVVLALTCLQVGAFSLLCSAYCRTPLGALIATYLLLPVMWVGLGLAVAVLYFVGVVALAFVGIDGEQFILLGTPVRYLFPWPMGLFELWGAGQTEAAVVKGGHIAASIVLFLALARRYLTRRALLPPEGELKSFFGWLDRIADVLGFRRMTVIRVRERLPGDEPIAWRELSRSALANRRYLLRIFVPLAVPTLVIALLGAAARYRQPVALLFGWYSIVWVLAVLFLALGATGAIAGERARRTLDVLLTTPISGADLVRQKLCGLRRLVMVFACLLVGLVVAVGSWRLDHVGSSAWLYLACSLHLVVVFLSLAVWLGAWVGLRVRSHSRAYMATVLALLAWNAGPPLLYVVARAATSSHIRPPDWRPLLFASPASLLRLVEGLGTPAMAGSVLPLHVLFAALAYGGVLVALRALCLKRADSYLGRARSLFASAREERP